MTGERCLTDLATNSTRLLNIGLRTVTLGTRFLFIFFLAKFLDPASVGYYGIFTATVGYALYFVGLDFYAYVTREILRTPAEQRGRLLKGQAVLAGILYLVLLPLGLVFLQQAGWPDHLARWFFPILLLEHFNQEISRLLIALSEQVYASLILFVRQGSWAIAIVVLMILDIRTRHLEAVMALWASAGIVAAGIGIWKLWQLRIGGWRASTDWLWIKKGIAVSTAFLVATLALRGIQTVDRYWLAALGGIEMVGAYVLLLGVASTMMVFLDAGVFAYTFPALIEHNHHNEHDAARAKVRRMLYQTLAFAAAFGIVSYLLLPYLLRWTGNPVYINSLPWYPWLLMAMTINAIGMVPHFALYARGRDKPIIYSHIGALLGFFVATWTLSKTYSALAVPLGLNIAFAIILVWKATAYWQLEITKSSQSQPHNPLDV